MAVKRQQDRPCFAKRRHLHRPCRERRWRRRYSPSVKWRRRHSCTYHRKNGAKACRRHRKPRRRAPWHILLVAPLNPADNLHNNHHNMAQKAERKIIKEQWIFTALFYYSNVFIINFFFLLAYCKARKVPLFLLLRFSFSIEGGFYF